jgi:hypothetical protein
VLLLPVGLVMLLLQFVLLLFVPGSRCARAGSACVFIRMGKHLLQQSCFCQL